jgi:hypothetical protein
MMKRILVALALAASLGGAVLACNTPAATTAPTVTIPSTAPASTGTGTSAEPSTPAASDVASPSSS